MAGRTPGESLGEGLITVVPFTAHPVYSDYRLVQHMYSLPYVALRYFDVYGPRMDIHGRYTEVLIRWMDRIASGQPPLILGDGKTTMDFVYIEDVARSNILAFTSGVTDDVFNVASGVETSLNDLAAALLKVMGRTSSQSMARSAR